ncbi:hypothetical protein [Vagococcus fluvialis]|uniref:hypothetical protein n=1 Tax=Vagococcus fluvialis TaxID=2738 RepID=UPI001D0A403E|nr:hypothetical protein [Vagococcus fluvialis]UDM72669.1 hypothetical protein K5L00_14875 [Vagococcus fluvialis]UDM78392.1 hypothetical protein K5K98_15080 [Vagococcus fluvialis]UDM83944.1 hypothetical protein K5K96_14900 [Vagococcus fluvialis]
MGRLIENIKSNAKKHQKEMYNEESANNDLAQRTFDGIIRQMNHQSKALGKTEFKFVPKIIPLAVDKMLRDEGFIVWRNSEVFKVVVPMEDE